MIIKPKIGSRKCCFRVTKTQNSWSFWGLCLLNPHQGSALDPLWGGGAYSTPSSFLVACGCATTKLLLMGLPGMYIKVVINLFFCTIISKSFDTGIYRPTSSHVPSRLLRVGLVYMEVAERDDCQILGFNFYRVT